MRPSLLKFALRLLLLLLLVGCIIALILVIISIRTIIFLVLLSLLLLVSFIIMVTVTIALAVINISTITFVIVVTVIVRLSCWRPAGSEFGAIFLSTTWPLQGFTVHIPSRVDNNSLPPKIWDMVVYGRIFTVHVVIEVAAVGCT